MFTPGWRIPINRSSPTSVADNSPEEVYCCQAGESITRDTALVRSCGLYFAPQRLHIGADVWGQYWQQRQAPAWLASLTTLKPETSVTVKSLLDSLATLPAQNKAQEVLLDVVLDEAKIGVASMLGSRVRVKTWSWFADDKQEIRQGGFAGWLTDGTPLWVTGSGTSKTVLTRYATVLNRVLPVPTQVCQWAMCRGGAVCPLSAEENHSGKEYDGSKSRRT